MRAVKSTLTIGEKDVPTLKPGEALVKINCFGVTQEDAELFKAGTAVSSLGVEFSGDVVSVSPSLPSTTAIKVGSRVMGFKIEGGAMAEYVACSVTMLLEIPAQMPYDVAATIPDMWIGALRLLRDDGELEKRNRIAIYNAFSSRGQAAVQLAQLMGCRRVHCIVSSKTAADNVTKHLRFHTALSDELPVHTAGSNVLGQIAAYDPRGLEVVLDLRKNPEIHPEMMRPQGRIVFTNTPLLDPSSWDILVLKGIKIHGSCVRSSDPRLLQPHFEYMAEHVLPKFKNKQLKQVIAKEFRWQNIKQAFNYVQDHPEMLGRVVCSVD